MQWDTSENAGFSKTKPWFYVNPNYKKVNVKSEESDPYSILNFYRRCLLLRKNSRTLIYGKYKEYFPEDKNIFMYERSLGNESYLVICSFSRLPVRAHKPERYYGKRGQLLLCNYPEEGQRSEKISLHDENVENVFEHFERQLTDIEHRKGLLRPFECRVYRYTNMDE